MKNTLKLELKKALYNKWFAISLFVACAISLSTAIIQIIAVLQDPKIYYDQANTAFSEGMFCRHGTEVAKIFYYIFPLLASIPYSWSYAYERKTGYEKTIIIRTGKNIYYLSKYIAMFVSGGLTILIALTLNFVTLTLFFPLITPNSYDMLYTGLTATHLFSDLFYTIPFLHLLIFFSLNFVFAGLISCLSFTLAIFVKNRLFATLFPFLFSLGFTYIHWYVLAMLKNFKYWFDPMQFLCANTATTTLEIVIIEIILLFIVTLVLILIRGIKNEVY